MHFPLDIAPVLLGVPVHISPLQQSPCGSASAVQPLAPLWIHAAVVGTAVGLGAAQWPCKLCPVTSQLNGAAQQVVGVVPPTVQDAPTPCELGQVKLLGLTH